MIKKVLIALLFFGTFTALTAQEWVNKMNDPHANFYEVEKAFNDYYKNHEKSGSAYKHFKRWAYFMEPRLYPSGDRISIDVEAELKSYNKQNRNQPQQKSANWTTLGKYTWNAAKSWNPGNGRVNTVRVDPTDTNKIFIGTPSGGMWKTTDGGLNWTPIGDDFSVPSVADILINPLNPNTIYIATGDAFNSSGLYGIGVRVSHDGGNTWNSTGFSSIRLQNIQCRRMAMNPLDTNTIFVATTVGLLKTSDAGATWANVLSGDIRTVKYKPNDTSIVYACTDQFYRSSDGGNTFSYISSNISSAASINRMEIAVSPDSPDNVYAVTGKQANHTFEGFYLSTDSGQTFTKVSSTPNILGRNFTGTDNDGQSWYDLAIAVNDTNGNEIYVGGINVWKSSDGGLTWSIVSFYRHPSVVGYTHADIHALEFYNNRLYCGSDGGVYYSTDNGITWNDISSGLNIVQYYKMSHTEQDARILLAGSQDNGCDYKDTLGNWCHIMGGDGMHVEINPYDYNKVYYAWENGGMGRSNDAGTVRRSIADTILSLENGAWVTPFQMDPNDTATIVAGYENVWKTTNGGNSWTKTSNFTTTQTIRQLKIAPSNSNHIYICRNDHRIRSSTDGGVTWTLRNVGLPNRIISDIEIHPLYEDSLWISFSGYFSGNKVYVSGNGGQSWTNLSTNMPNLPVNDLAYDTLTQVLYAATDFGVYYQDRTINLGWNAYNTNLPNVIVSELLIHRGTESLRAATYGRGIWESPLIKRNISTSLDENDEITNSIRLSPNPTHGMVQLKWDNPTSYTFRLYGITGRLIDEKRTIDAKGTAFDLSALSRGVYMIECIGVEGKQVLRVVKD